jgi:hypothetical protein
MFHPARAHKLGNITTAVLPRLIERDQPTLLLDEADNLDFQADPALRSILNDGFYEGGRKALVSNQEVVSTYLLRSRLARSASCRYR